MRATAASRLLDRPAAIALIFAPFAIATWLLRTDALGLAAPAAIQATEALQLATLLAGAALFWVATRGDPVRRGAARWRWALIAGLAALAAQVAVAEMRPAAGLDFAAAAARWANLVLIAGFAEELWFRGLWMRAARGSLALAVGAGALGFGLLHWPLGLGRVATTAAVGALYGAARWRGAPIWALALAHGSVDWISGVAAPATAWRFGAGASQALFCAIALIATGAILWRGSKGDTA